MCGYAKRRKDAHDLLLFDLWPSQRNYIYIYTQIYRIYDQNNENSQQESSEHCYAVWKVDEYQQHASILLDDTETQACGICPMTFLLISELNTRNVAKFLNISHIF